MANVFRITYVSSAVKAFGRDELVALLARSRENNSHRGITGLLLYKDGNFLQVLEGEEAVVRSVFETISRDRRHHGVIEIFEESTPDRLFDDWSMGFRNLADPEVLAMPGFSRFMQLSLSAKQFEPDLGVCWDLLRFFRDDR